MLKRQALWQRRRQSLTWPEKIRMAEMVRESAKQRRAPSVAKRSQETAARQILRDRPD